MKDTRLSLPLTEVMKIARLTSLFLNVPRQSSPRPRLKHGRRLALFHLNLTLNLCTVLCSIAGSSSSSSSSSNFPNCSSLRESASIYATYLRSHFSVSQPEAISLSSAKPCTPWSLTCLFALLSLPLNFLWLPPTSPHSLPLAQTKLPI